MPVDYKYRDPLNPKEAKDCDKSCGKKCENGSELSCIDECEEGRFASSENNPH